MSIPEALKKLSFYGSNRVTDVPVEIGVSPGHIMTLSSTGRTAKDLTPTIYYKVVRRCVHSHKNKDITPPASYYPMAELWTCPCGANITETSLVEGYGKCGLWTLTEYIYFYLYFPVDTNHLHDWTGGMLEVVDGVPKRLVCRSHWGLVVSDDGECMGVNVFIEDSTHSLSHQIPLTKWDPIDDPTLVELTPELLAKVKQYEEDTLRSVTVDWADRKMMVWCRYRHRWQYKKMCRAAGLKWKWYQWMPDPAKTFQDHPELWFKIIGRIGK